MPALAVAANKNPQRLVFNSFNLHRRLLTSVKVNADQMCSVSGRRNRFPMCKAGSPPFLQVPTLAGEVPKFVGGGGDLLTPLRPLTSFEEGDQSLMFGAAPGDLGSAMDGAPSLHSRCFP